MTWLKVDLHDMRNCICVCRGGDPCNAYRIEVYYSIESILIPEFNDDPKGQVNGVTDVDAALPKM